MILIFTKILNNLYKLTKYYTLFKECNPCNICFSLDKKLTMSAAKRESEDDLSELSWNKIDLSNGILSPKFVLLYCFLAQKVKQRMIE